MTTPLQRAPDGAYVIDDGGGDQNYGQGVTDGLAAQQMLAGFTLLTNPISALAHMAETLLKLPLEVLQLFAPLIPDAVAGAFDTVAGAVDAILGWFQGLGPLLQSAFEVWVVGTFNVLNTVVQQILEILNGLIVTPINALVQGVKDWFGGVQGTTGGVTDLIGGIVGGVVSGVGSFWDAVAAMLGQGPAAIPAYTPSNSAISNVQGQINAIQAQISTTGEGAADGFNYSPLSPTLWAPVYGVAEITSGGYVWNPGGSGNRYSAQKFIGPIPDTTLWQVQMTVMFPQGGGATSVFGKSRFGGGANASLTGRFPAVELYVDQFGAFVRLGSLVGPVNDFFLGNAGWTQYGEVNLASVLKTGDVLALEVDEVNKIYRLYLNPGPGSSPILSFLDSGNTMVRGPANRTPWFQLDTNNDAFGVGNGWDNFFVFDRV